MTDWNQKILPLAYDVDGDTKSIKIEKNTDGLKTISSEHSKIWEGYAFKSSHIDYVVSASTSLSICLSIPSTVEYAHIYHDVFRISGGPFTTHVYEGATISLTGSEKAITNINRLSANASKLVMAHDPAVIDFGTLLDSDYIPSDKSTSADNNDDTEHFILTPGNHVFKAFSNSNQTQSIIFRIAWYEKWV